MFPEIKEQGAFIIFTIKVLFYQLEPNTQEIAAICYEKDAQEILNSINLAR